MPRRFALSFVVVPALAIACGACVSTATTGASSSTTTTGASSSTTMTEASSFTTRSNAGATGATTDELVSSDGLSSRAKVVRLLEEGIGQANPAIVRGLIGPRYTQHNPRVPDGPEGLIGFIEWLRTAPATSRPKVKIVRAFVDGDYAFTHGEYRRRTSVAGFDLFRLEDGKLAEHWDAGQTQPDVTASGRSMLDGDTEITDLDETVANKTLVRRFAEEVLVQRKLDALASFFAGDALVQHSPRIADGVPALVAALAESPLRHGEVRRVLGEGNFVLVQSRASLSGKPAVTYDLFRVAVGKIAEHWAVVEEVPAQSENDNGMW